MDEQGDQRCGQLKLEILFEPGCMTCYNLDVLSHGGMDVPLPDCELNFDSPGPSLAVHALC